LHNVKPGFGFSNYVEQNGEADDRVPVYQVFTASSIFSANSYIR